MRSDLADRLVADYEQGRLSRRELATRLMGLGAALAAAPAAAATARRASTFTSTGIDHVALTVTDVARSRDFYRQHLGLEVVREGQNNCFMGRGDGFFLALFQGDEPRMNHYCHAIEDYDPDRVVRALRDAGIEPRREGDRVYFDDPDGLEVQVSGS